MAENLSSVLNSKKVKLLNSINFCKREQLEIITKVNNVITINNQTGRPNHSKRMQRAQKQRPVAAIEPSARIISSATTSSGHNSGDKDLINGLINTVNKQKDLLKLTLKETPNPALPLILSMIILRMVDFWH